MATAEVARFSGRAHVALFDATTLTARGVKNQLVARGFPTASVRLFTSSTDPDSNLTEFAGEAMLVTTPDFDALGSLDIAFLCGTRREGERYLDWPERAGFVAIDLTRSLSGAAHVPPVNASVNPEAILAGHGVVRTPHPISQMLSTLLAPVLGHCGLREALAVVLKPASENGTPGIGELYQQTLSLMNFSEMPRQVFGRQLAFNLIPGFLGDGGEGAGAMRADLEREVRSITGGRYALSVQVIQAPLFHCHAAMIHLVLAKGKEREDLLAAFKGMEDVSVGRRDDKVTPVERAGEGGLIVAGAEAGLRENSYWIWAVADDLAGGTSRNAVRIAEAILSRGLRRGRA